MLHPSLFHDYQTRGVNHIIEHPRSMLWLFMGSGKTIMTLTAIRHLIRHRAIRSALVLGPKRVVESVWERETRKWSHLHGLTCSHILGNPQERLCGLTRPADIYLCNYENLPWLVAQLEHYFINNGVGLPFDMLVLDESTKMKHHDTKRLEALAKVLPYFHRRVGLTGSPASQGLIDLFGQFLAIDDGARLGYSYSAFTDRFFTPTDRDKRKFKVTEPGKLQIFNLVSDIVMELSSSESVRLPDMIENEIVVQLPPRARTQYDKLEREFFVELDSGCPLEVANEAAKINKLLQFSNGAVYTDTETRAWESIHDAKLDALDDIVEEAAGNPVLVGYLYRTDLHRIMARYPDARNITGMSGAEFAQALEDWRAGRLRLLLGHPASMGHGIDGLQEGGHIGVWFGLPWPLELYDQFNARLHRQGQGDPVVIHKITTENTMDLAPHTALRENAAAQAELRRAVAEYNRTGTMPATAAREEVTPLDAINQYRNRR